MHNQLSLHTLGPHLSQVTFVVVDLETTGGAPQDAGITEIGAVKIRGGEVIGEFQSLVNPGVPLSPFITALTGISDSMLADAPSLAGVFPAFLEFMHGTVLVAHNAPYDIGFLKGAAAKLGHEWPGPDVVDTIRMARAALANGEVRNRKLSTLAEHFRAPMPPTHRALDDARATVHVFHALLERLAGQGVEHFEDLTGLGPRIAARRATKRHLAEGLPQGPGVYIFEDRQGRALYIGKSANVYKRVRSYFTAAETRDRIERMLDLTQSVRAIACETDFEALIRETRLIEANRPPFNRVGVRPEKTHWVRITREPFPRISIVREHRPDKGWLHLGPYRSIGEATAAAEALGAASAVRTCKITINTRNPVSACALADMGRCSAPCDHRIDRATYAQVTAAAVALCDGDGAVVTERLEARQRELAADQRYEEASVARDRLLAFVTGNAKRQRLGLLRETPEIVAALPRSGGWDAHVIRYGRLTAAAHIRHTQDHRAAIEALRLTAAHVDPEANDTSWRETAMVHAWLVGEGVRLVHLDGVLASTWPGAAAAEERLAPAFTARERAQTMDFEEWQRERRSTDRERR